VRGVGALQLVRQPAGWIVGQWFGAPSSEAKSHQGLCYLRIHCALIFQFRSLLGVSGLWRVNERCFPWSGEAGWPLPAAANLIGRPDHAPKARDGV
jgi:hypothetical protein